MSYGMNVSTGARIDGLQHIEQSIAQILTTPIGTRVMRREFGSLIPELIDQPLNDETRLMIYAATATALYKWEPRFRLTRVQLIVQGLSGAAELHLTGAVRLGGRWMIDVTMTVLIKG